jgi:hypothetical protein
MKSRFTTFLLLMVAMMIAAPQALALDIQVLPNGRIEFYSGSVLGYEDNLNELREKQSERKDEREDKEDDHRDEKREEMMRKTPKPESRIRAVNQGERQELRIRTDDDKVRVELRDGAGVYPAPKPTGFRKTEEMESEDVHLQFPTSPSRDQLEAAKKKQEFVRETVKDQLEERFEGDEGRREEFKTRIEEEQAQHQEYWEKLREERQGRKEEIVELKNKFKDKKQTLEFKSRNVKAALQKGAEFALDPTTNEVTVMTPSGEEHTLNHLPDQAIERMTASGFFSGSDGIVEEDVEVETNDQGELIYRKKDKIKKKFFGLFPRQIDSEIVLNDATGEVMEYEAAPSSIFEQFLNSVSF